MTVYASCCFTIWSLHFKVTFVSQPFRLIPSVTPKNVATLIRLKIPRRNQNNIAFPNPHPPLQLTTNPAQPLFTILTPHQNPFSTKHLNSRTQHIASTRQQHVFKVTFICDFSFAHLSNTKSCGRTCIRHSFVNQNNLEKKQNALYCRSDSSSRILTVTSK